MPFSLIGRILFSLPIVAFGLGHLANGAQMAGMVPSWVPGGVFWVYVTGVALVAGGAAIIANKLAFQAALGLALLLAIFALTIHLPAMLAGQQMGMVSLFKDLSMAGAALYIAGHSKN